MTTSLFEENRSSPAYWARAASLEFVHGILRLMDEDAVSRGKLAERYGASAPNITKLLSSSKNLQLKTMHKLADALGAAVHVIVVRKTDWFQYQTRPKTTGEAALRKLGLDGSSRDGGARASAFPYFPGADDTPPSRPL